MAASTNQSSEPDKEYGDAYAPPRILPETSSEETKAVIDDRNTELWMDEKRAKAAPEPLTRFERWWEYGAEGAGGAASDDPDAPQGGGGAPPSLPEGAGGYGGGSAVGNREVYKETGPAPGPRMDALSEEEQSRVILEQLAADQPQPGKAVARKMGMAWGAYPPELRPDILAGGLPVYGQGDYAGAVGRAVAAGKINPQQGDAAIRAYVKWQKSPWGAQVHLHRVNREHEWIAQDAKGEMELLGSEAAARQAKIHDEELEAVQEERIRYEEFRADYERDLSETLAKQDQAIDELSKKEVDPNRWYNSKDTGGKILAVLAMSLGNLGSSLSKSPNWAAGLIKSQIDADIRAQVYTLRNQRGAISARSGLVGQLNQRFNNLNQSVKIARLLMSGQTMAKTRSLAANLRSDTQRRNYKLIMDLQEHDYEKLKAEVNAMAAQKAQARAAAQARVRMARRRAEMERRKMPRMGKQLAKYGMQWTMPGGQTGVLTGLGSAAERKKFQESYANLVAYTNAEREIRALREQYNGAVDELMMKPKDATRMRQLGAILMNAGRIATGSGANYTEIEQKLVELAGGLDRFKKGGGRFTDFVAQLWEGRRDENGDVYMPFSHLVKHNVNVHNNTYRGLGHHPGTFGLRMDTGKGGGTTAEMAFQPAQEMANQYFFRSPELTPYKPLRN